MAKTPAEIFKAFDDKELLVAIAITKNLEVTDSFRKNIVKHLAKYVTSIGLKKILSLITYDDLKALAADIPTVESKTKHGKASLAKRICEHMESVGVSKFLESRDAALMDKILERLEAEVDNGKRTEAFLAEADLVGLEYLFSSFPTDQLKTFVESCDLKVNSDSREILIQSLVDQKNHKAKPRKKKSLPKPSKHKPDVKKGISKVDLNHHYSREELSEWLKENELPVSGTKKEIIQRILDHFAGKKIVSRKRKAAAPAGGKKRSPVAKKARKTSTEDAKKETKKATNK